MAEQRSAPKKYPAPGEEKVSEPVQPKIAIPLEELGEPVQPRIPVPWWRWVVAALLAPVIFVLALFPFAICNQLFDGIPDRYAFVPITALVALPLAVTIWALRGVVRPKPRKRRGFAVIRKNPNP